MKGVTCSRWSKVTAFRAACSNELVDAMIADFAIGKVDYLSNLTPPTFPDGLDVEVFTFSSLQQAARNAVTLDIDANGILNVSAKDKATGKSHNIRIEAKSGLSKEEIDRMKREAEMNADADKKAKEELKKVELILNIYFGGSDGTRTRDLSRDRRSL